MFRSSFLSIIALSLVFFALRIPVYAQSSSVLTENLTVGSYGPQVKALQELLNKDPNTQIASEGVGSPGNETLYFGALTQNAVMRFQQKYASDVLAPVDLTAPNGFVGFYTRKKINNLCTANCVADSTPIVAPTTVSVTPPTTTSTPTTQTLTPHELLLNDMIATAKARGFSAEAISIIKTEMQKRATSTSNTNASILKDFSSATTAATDTSFMGSLSKVASTIRHFFEPQKALAAIGVSFGGSLIGGELICNYESQYLIEITPHPPSYAVFLTYTPGSQRYSAYNIPLTQQILGSYTPGPAGTCIIGACPFCIDFPTSGLITPQVGSTLIP